MILWSLVFAIGLTAVHLGSKYMGFLGFMPRSKLLSIGGGVSVAYVFIHILPELNKHQSELRESGLESELSFLEHHVYLVSMIGLASFYGLERMARLSKKETSASKRIFWTHVLSFALYNGLIGYLLIRGESSKLSELFTFFLALAVHFIANDHSMRESHKRTYDKYGRWLLSVSILAGWVIGYFSSIDKDTIAVLFALLAGAIVLNVLKEELPEQRQSNFWAFFGGMIAYTILLLAL
ncbi:hypothetical protein AM500_21280 [Bacillus sp. FJAT-18017]|uniref:hypothetical protein n=1 Tax=Bacillus sp. FJAT-18017 TaxID=1705566 RepID=UPI0006AF9FA8|nr:hypothetical protein [Bacillus sp. FJAT-18017]ALC92042.1 hypothetical protein AM500_21280 [Bacillus sp. FJAT-18017]